MADVNLGNLSFDVKLKDLTDADIKKIQKKIEKLGGNVPIDLKVNKGTLVQSVKDALKNENITINVKAKLDANTIKNLTDALNRGLNLNPNAIRNYNTQIQDLTRSMRDLGTQMQDVVNNSNGLSRVSREMRNLREAGKGATYITDTLKKLLSSFGSVFSVQEILRDVVQIGGELQKQKIALSSILQDAGLAATQFSKIQSLAVRSPFGIMELSQYSKQLASYATPYYELYDTMKRIADISAGVGVDMGRIILAYGQVKNAGFLKGTELRQFTEANIPLLDKLAERFSQLEGKVISTSDVMEMISKRKVGFEDVKEVLFELTEAGGMFYNMQEVLADSLAAKWKNLTDAIHNANLEMADSKFVGGTLKTIAEILTSLAGDWRSLGSTALVAISTFKIFKPASNAFVDALTNATRRTNALAYATKGLRTGWLKFISVIKTASKELLTFLPTAIISGIVFIGSKLWFDYKKRQEELEEQTQRNRDSYEGLYNSIKKFEGIDWDFSENTERELKEISKELQEILLNHLPNAGEVLNNIFKKDSGLKTYTEQIEALKNEVLALKDAREQLAGSGLDPAMKANAATAGILGYNSFGDFITEYTSYYNSLMQSISKLVKANPGKYQKYLIKGKTLSESIFEAIINGTWEEDELETKINAFFLKRSHTKDWKGRVFFENIKAQYAGQIEAIQEKILKGEELSAAEESIRKQVAVSVGQWLQKTLAGAPKYIQDEIYQEALKNLGIDFQAKADVNYDILTALQHKMIQQSTLEGMVKSPIESIIKTTADVTKLYEQFQEQWREDVATIKANEDILKKEGVDVSKITKENKGELLLTSIQKEAYENWKRAEDSRKAIEALQAIYGFNLKEKGKTAEEEKEDALYEKLNNRYTIIKKIIDAYEKLRVVVGKEKAAEAIKSNEEFKEAFDGTYGFELDLNNPLPALRKILDELGDSEKQQKLKVTIGYYIDGLKLDHLQENISKRLKQVEADIKKQTSDWNLYEKLFEATGSKEFANKAYDGIMIFDELSKNMNDSLKKQVKERLGADWVIPAFSMNSEEAKLLFEKENEDLYTIWLATKQRIEQKGIDHLVNMASIQKEFMGVEKQLSAIEERRKHALLEVAEGSEDEKLINAKYDEEINELLKSSKELLPVWHALFNEITDAGIRKLKDILKSANTLRENAVKFKDDLSGEYKYKLTFDNGKEITLTQKEYEKFLEQIESTQDKLAKENPFRGMIDGFKEFKKINNDKGLTDEEKKNKKELAWKDLGTNISAITGELANTLNAWGDMFSSFGDEATADALGFAGEITDAFGTLFEDITSGNPFQMIFGILSFIPNVISKINAFHDSKLNRTIEKSRKKIEDLKFEYEDLQRTIERQLGGYMKGQAETQLNNLQSQLDETKKMMEAEDDKKKTDHDKMRDYKQSIAELQDQIKYFYEDLASEQYGANIKDWAKTISDALVGAFAEGTDAALAFDNAVSDIMKDVVSQMINLQVIQPAMAGLREKLFGEGGIFSEDSAGGTHVTKEESVILAKSLKELRSKIEGSQEIWDEINEQTGGILNTQERSSSLSASIQNITESTADLLGSYLNAVRADVSINRTYMQRIAEVDMPRISMTAEAQLRQLEQIVMNTQTIKEHTRGMLDILSQATKFADRGFYMR